MTSDTLTEGFVVRAKIFRDLVSSFERAFRLKDNLSLSDGFLARLQSLVMFTMVCRGLRSLFPPGYAQGCRISRISCSVQWFSYTLVWDTRLAFLRTFLLSEAGFCRRISYSKVSSVYCRMAESIAVQCGSSEASHINGCGSGGLIINLNSWLSCLTFPGNYSLFVEHIILINFRWSACAL